MTPAPDVRHDVTSVSDVTHDVTSVSDVTHDVTSVSDVTHDVSSDIGQVFISAATEESLLFFSGPVVSPILRWSDGCCSTLLDVVSKDMLILLEWFKKRLSEINRGR